MERNQLDVSRVSNLEDTGPEVRHVLRRIPEFEVAVESGLNSRSSAWPAAGIFLSSN
jgi:hypothetical protein